MAILQKSSKGWTSKAMAIKYYKPFNRSQESKVEALVRQLAEKLSPNSIKYNVNLKDTSHIRASGTVRYLIEPRSKQELREIFKLLSSSCVTPLFLGNMSNSILEDGIANTIFLSSKFLTQHSLEEDTLNASSVVFFLC